jgi:hypothetical protein
MSFMDILRKPKKTGLWTSEQQNFIVGSKSIDEETMERNLDDLDIN